MRLVLEPALLEPLVPLSQRKGRFRETAPISIPTTSSGGPRRFGDFHIFHDSDGFRAMRLVLEPAPLTPLNTAEPAVGPISQNSSDFCTLLPVLGVPEDLETFIFFMTWSIFWAMRLVLEPAPLTLLNTAEPAVGPTSQNSSDLHSVTSSGCPRRFGDFHILHDLVDFL